MGNLLSQTDGKGNTTRYTYNVQNQPILRADPGGMTAGGVIEDEERVERYTYDADVRRTSKQDKNGIVATYTYDTHGRVLTETIAGELTAYTYDKNGNIRQITRSGQTQQYHYDVLNRLTEMTDEHGTTSRYAYDITSGVSTGQLATTTTLDGRTTRRVFDRVGRLSQVQEADGAITGYQYYNNGALKQQTLPGSVTANYTYDANNRLQTLENKKGTNTLEGYRYVYDGAGNMTAKEDIKGTTVYTYTNLSQLQTVTEPTDKVTTYTYDAAGNRQSQTVAENGQTTTTTYEVNEQNRLLQTEQQTPGQAIIEQYFYDAAGNMLARKPEVLTDADPNAIATAQIGQLGNMPDMELTPALYGYNARNQMVEAVTGTAQVENTFNALGLRSTKAVGDTTSSYSYENQRVVKEVDSSGSTAYNIYGINLISRTVDGEKVYYLYNGHADVTALINSNGTIIASYYYDAFGEIVEQTGDYHNPYCYSGYHYDEESELYDLKTRFYDAKLARFMQEDTYLGETQDPLSLNLYTYCANNSLIYYDPSGHNPAAILVYVSAVLTSPDLQMDMQYFADSMSRGDYLAAFFDAVGILIPGGTGLGSAASGIASNVKRFFLNHSDDDIRTTKILFGDGKIAFGYKTLKKIVKGMGQEVHHLIEKRFAKVLGIDEGEILSIAIDKAKHNTITQRMRQLIGYKELGLTEYLPALKQQLLDTATNVHEITDWLGW